MLQPQQVQQRIIRGVSHDRDPYANPVIRETSMPEGRRRAMRAALRVGVMWTWFVAMAGVFLPSITSATTSPSSRSAAPSASAGAIARAVGETPIVLLGEVHDNATLHAIRLEALRALIATGRRPALAFEQFDRDRQPDIERARTARPGDADHLIEAAGADSGWDWSHYRPYVKLALDHGLPVLAANLSRSDAMRASMEGFAAVLGADRASQLALDHLPEPFLAAHRSAVAEGHCNLLPETMLPAIARAQIARDIVLADALQQHAERGVVLLTGNGHARTDIGVPYWLTAQERGRSVSVGLLEVESTATSGGPPPPYDVVFSVAAPPRPDPCIALRERFGAMRGR
jgi:uncharacterized iron-regulated protein